MSTRNNRSDIHRKRHLRKREWRQALEKQVKEDLAQAAQPTPEAHAQGTVKAEPTADAR